MSSERPYGLSEKEEAEILRENREEDPVAKRIRYFVSRKQWGRTTSPRNVFLIDFIGNGTFYSVNVDNNGRFRERIYPDNSYHPGSDVFAQSLFEGKIPDDVDPEEKLRGYFGF